MSEWSRYLVCECCWWDEPSFGSRWFSEMHHPVCPDCARSTSEAKMVTARVVGVFRRRLVLREEAQA